MNKILFSTDADVLQSYLVVTDADTSKQCNAFYLAPVDDDTKFQVYTFDLLDTLDDWYDIEELESFTGENYREAKKDFHFWCQFTADVCSYYSPLNFGAPMLIEANKLEDWLKQ